MNLFQTTNWDQLVATETKGETGFSRIKTTWLQDIQIRMVEYSANYKADHWCSKGHIVYCISGSYTLHFKDGSTYALASGSSYQTVENEDNPHLSISQDGCQLFIVDGGFLQSKKISIQRTDAKNPHYQKLIIELDALLQILDGDEHSFYAQYNTSDDIKYVAIAYEDGVAVACGAIKEYAQDTMEIKRMYTIPSKRGQGIATQMLSALENWAQELGFQKCILETGKPQIEAITLYKKCAYQIIPNYGQYTNVENSICFEKILS